VLKEERQWGRGCQVMLKAPIPSYVTIGASDPIRGNFQSDHRNRLGFLRVCSRSSWGLLGGRLDIGLSAGTGARGGRNPVLASPRRSGSGADRKTGSRCGPWQARG